MSRLTVHQVQLSSFPQVVGLCASDLPQICNVLNEIVERLLSAKEVGDAGWWGTYQKVVFTVDPLNPFVTTPREVARLEDIDICGQPIQVRNQFFEFMLFGNGLQRPPCTVGQRCSPTQAYDRGTVSTWVTIPAGNIVRVYPSNVADVNKRVFFKANDSNGQPIYTIDNGVQVNGFFISLATPFADSVYTLQADGIMGIQKDTTLGPVTIYGVDPVSGAQTLLVTLAPNETAPSFRRYFLANLPRQCFTCGSPGTTVQMTAMAQLEFVPVTCDTDYLLINSLPALIAEGQSWRLERMDNPTAKQEALAHHKQAIRYLQGQLVKYEGRANPILQFHPFGRQRLGRSTNLSMV